MNKNIIIVFSIIILVVIGLVYISLNNNDREMVKEDNLEQGINIKKDDQFMVDEKDAQTMIDKDDSAPKIGLYEVYSPDKIAKAQNNDVVIFFHASWCPSCRSLNSNIENNLGSIPEGVIILKADYDKETELKKKYGVTYQHTLVQVDKNGGMIKKWSGSPSLSDVISQIK